MRSGILFAIIIVFSSILSACAPVGFLDHDTVYDDMWAVPRRQVYNVGDRFILTNDLLVFASYRGMTETIDVNRVNISLIPRPDSNGNGNGSANIPVTNGSLLLTPAVIGSGRKLIVVSYQDMTTNYSIEVNDPYGLAPDDDDGNTGGGGIGIIWKD